jgi:hypothetical protein
MAFCRELDAKIDKAERMLKEIEAQPSVKPREGGLWDPETERLLRELEDYRGKRHGGRQDRAKKRSAAPSRGEAASQRAARGKRGAPRRKKGK